MTKNSMIGPSIEKKIKDLTKKIKSNAGFLTKQDIEVLEHLGKKGNHDSKQAVLLEFPKEDLFFPKPNMDEISSVPFIDEVEEFNEMMGKGSHNRKKPHIDPVDAQFVVDFIREELKELELSIQKNDIVGVLDALLDITYVGLGNGALVFGLKDKILAGYEEVQASNMSKICKTKEEAKQTVTFRKGQGYDCYYEQVGDGWVVYRTSNKKIMKSINYFPPNLKKLFKIEELEELFHYKNLQPLWRSDNRRKSNKLNYELY